jgi:hypothetical protein
MAAVTMVLTSLLGLWAVEEFGGVWVSMLGELYMKAWMDTSS